MSVFNEFPLKTEGSFPCRGSLYPPAGGHKGCASCGDGVRGVGGEGSLTGGVSILRGTGAAVVS